MGQNFHFEQDIETFTALQKISGFLRLDWCQYEDYVSVFL